MPTSRDCFFPAAVLKGVIEHQDGTAFFGSLGGYLEYVEQAIQRGWLVRVETPAEQTTTPKLIKFRIKYAATEKGVLHHKGSGLNNLPSVKYIFEAASLALVRALLKSTTSLRTLLHSKINLSSKPIDHL